MYHGVGQTLSPMSLDECREGLCADPRCWNTFPAQCNEWVRAQFLVGCLESNCADSKCRDAFPDECRRGAPPPAMPKETTGFSGKTMLLLGVSALAIGLWLGRRKNA